MFTRLCLDYFFCVHGSVNAVFTCVCEFAFGQHLCSRFLASECSRVCVYAVFTGFWVVFVFACLRFAKVRNDVLADHNWQHSCVGGARFRV